MATHLEKPYRCDSVSLPITEAKAKSTMLIPLFPSMGDTEQTFRPYNLDARGHFLIEGVAAGSYELNVSANVPRGQGPTAKQRIEVSEGTVTDVVVSLDLKPEPVQRPIP